MTIAPAADHELVARFAAGDEAAFTEFVERHHHWVSGVCARRLPAADADDATQATFIIVSRKAEALVTHPCLPGWLHRTASQVVNNALRRHANRRSAEAVAANTGPAAAPPPVVEHDLDGAVDALPRPQRDVVVLHYFLGLDHGAIAARIGVPVGTVKTRLHRALHRLRRRLGAPAATALAALAVPPSSLMPIAHPVNAATPAAAQLASATIHASVVTTVTTLAGVAIAAVATLTLAVSVTGHRAAAPPVPRDPPAIEAPVDAVALAEELMRAEHFDEMAADLLAQTLDLISVVDRERLRGREAAVVATVSAVLHGPARALYARHLSTGTLRARIAFTTTPAGARASERLRAANLHAQAFLIRHGAAIFRAAEEQRDDPTLMSMAVSDSPSTVSPRDAAPIEGAPERRVALARRYVELSGLDAILARSFARTYNVDLARRDRLAVALAPRLQEPLAHLVAIHLDDSDLACACAFAARPDAGVIFSEGEAAWVAIEHEAVARMSSLIAAVKAALEDHPTTTTTGDF